MRRQIVLTGLVMSGALSLVVGAQAPKPAASAVKVMKLKDNLYVLNALRRRRRQYLRVHHRNGRCRRRHEESGLGPAAAGEDQDAHAQAGDH